jgi:hypothetical protein
MNARDVLDAPKPAASYDAKFDVNDFNSAAAFRGRAAGYNIGGAYKNDGGSNSDASTSEQKSKMRSLSGLATDVINNLTNATVIADNLMRTTRGILTDKDGKSLTREDKQKLEDEKGVCFDGTTQDVIDEGKIYKDIAQGKITSPEQISDPDIRANFSAHLNGIKEPGLTDEQRMKLAGEDAWRAHRSVNNLDKDNNYRMPGSSLSIKDMHEDLGFKPAENIAAAPARAMSMPPPAPM